MLYKVAEKSSYVLNRKMWTWTSLSTKACRSSLIQQEQACQSPVLTG